RNVRSPGARWAVDSRGEAARAARSRPRSCTYHAGGSYPAIARATGRGIDSGPTVRHPPAVTTAGAIDELDDHQHAAVHAAGDATGHDASGDADAGDGRMFCYRHPDRETWLRCGRCD